MRRLILLLLCLCGFAAILVLALPTAAQTRPGTADLVDTSDTADPPSLGTRVLIWGVDQQRHFQRALTQRMRDLVDHASFAAVATLMLVSFLYGVFHAAGPGHGKAVLSAYLLSHREHLRRGRWMAAAAALCQGLVALLLVYGLVAIVGRAARDAQDAVAWAERLSFGLVVLVGALLAWRGLAPLTLQLTRRLAPGAHTHHHEHTHDHERDAAGCGHMHLPSASDIAAAKSIRAAIGVILSIGLRPCSGAVLVLAVAQIMGLMWAGAGAVGAMSLGTALAIASLAFLVVHFRNGASRLVARQGLAWELAGHAIALLGGLAILWIGATLFASSWGPRHPFGF